MAPRRARSLYRVNKSSHVPVPPKNGYKPMKAGTASSTDEPAARKELAILRAAAAEVLNWAVSGSLSGCHRWRDLAANISINLRNSRTSISKDAKTTDDKKYSPRRRRGRIQLNNSADAVDHGIPQRDRLRSSSRCCRLNDLSMSHRHRRIPRKLPDDDRSNCSRRRNHCNN